MGFYLASPLRPDAPEKYPGTLYIYSEKYPEPLHVYIYLAYNTYVDKPMAKQGGF